MHSSLSNLLILQEKDKKIFNAQADIESVPLEASKIKISLEAQLKLVETAKQALLNAQKAVSQVELDRQTRKDTILKLKMRQGETKKNEEYQMLSHEIARYTKEVDELETQELALMEKVDERKQEMAKAKLSFTQEKEFATNLSKNLLKRKKIAEEVLSNIKGDRFALAQKIDPEVLELYERVLKARGIGAIALVTEAGQCSGCNIKLPPAVYHVALSATELVQCNECSRIVYNA